MGLFIRRFAIVFFEDHLTIKIFLVICLFFLAVYLFFLHSKITFWRAWLSRKIPNNRQPKLFRKINIEKKSTLAQSSIVTRNVFEPVSDDVENQKPNGSENQLSNNETKIENENDEKAHQKAIIDRILHRNNVIEKKLRVLQILWGVLVVLTLIFIFTY
jgi:hypothetical protein